MKKGVSCEVHNHKNWLEHSTINITDLRKEVDFLRFVEGGYKISSECNDIEFKIHLLEGDHDSYVDFYNLSEDYKINNFKRINNEQ